MPDIAMCKNKNCKKHMSCFRFRAKPKTYQTYMFFRPAAGHDRCESFVPLKGKEGRYYEPQYFG